jgi:hypothetical protein
MVGGVVRKIAKKNFAGAPRKLDCGSGRLLNQNENHVTVYNHGARQPRSAGTAAHCEQQAAAPRQPSDQSASLTNSMGLPNSASRLTIDLSSAMSEST